MERNLRNALVFGGGFLLIICVMLMINAWITGEVSTIQDDKKNVQVVQRTQPAQPQKSTGKITRMTMLDPSREFSLNFIMRGDDRIATFKSRRFEMWDLDGKIPDGRITFKDIAQNTYGDENYLNNRRDGLYQEYYDNGTLRYEVYFDKGDLKKVSEYYYDGSLRMEADYSDALFITDDIEAGEGKIYYRDGTLAYEWSLTNLKEMRYKTSYNFKGQKTETKLYDDGGNLVETIDYRKK